MSVLNIKAAISSYLQAAGIPESEFSSDFIIKMLAAMMVSYHKYGLVADAYPAKFDAMADLRARAAKYRETGDKQYLVDAANFAMIEAMHSNRPNAFWGHNDEDTSIGRTDRATRNLVHRDNQDNRLERDRK